MKKFIATATLSFAVLFFTGTTANAQPQGNGQGQNLIGQAKGAFHANCPNPNIPLTGYLQGPTGLTDCQVGIDTYRVYLVWKPNCNQVPCELILLAPVGYVDFDCFGNIVDVHCGF